MAINPITWFEEEKKVLWYTEDQVGIPWVNIMPTAINGSVPVTPPIMTPAPTQTPPPAPTVATPTQPIVDKEKVWVTPAPLDFTKDNLVNILWKDPNKLSEDEKTFVRKVKARQSLGESMDSIFWSGVWTTWTTSVTPWFTEAEKAIEAEKTRLAGVSWAKTDIRQQEIQARTDANIKALEESGRKQMDALKSSLSFSGFWRSSVWVEKQAEVEKSIQDRIANEKMIAQKEMDIYKLELQWADEKVISWMREDLSKAKLDLQVKQQEASIATAKMNMEAWLKWQEALTNFLNSYTWGVDQAKKEWFDEKTSLALWYVSDKFWNPVKKDDKWNPIAFQWNDLNSDIKITNFKDANDNTYVYKNWRLDSIIQTDWQIIQWDGLNNKQVPASVISSKKEKESKDIESALRKEFTSREEVKAFNAIRSQYARVEQAKAMSEKQTWVWDVALIFAYMKMLDPTSVVREGEFATAQNTWWVESAISNLYNKALSWKFLTPQQREEIANLSKNLYWNQKDVVQSVINQYENIAKDSWARPEMIIWDFDVWVWWVKPISQKDDTSEIDNIFWWATTQTKTPNLFTPTSGKNFNVPTPFKPAELPAWTKGLDFSMNTDLIKKYPNEASFKNNNPTWITVWISQRTKDLLSQYGIQYEPWTARPKNEGWNYYKFPDVQTWLKAYWILLTKAWTDDIHARLKQWVWSANSEEYANSIMKKAWIEKWKKFSELSKEELVQLMAVQLQRESPNFYKQIIS